MSLGVLSLLGLAVAIVISCISENNIGLLAMGLSYIIGVQYGGMSVANIIKGFPLSLFLTLVGVTYLFTIALVNGTLEKLTRQVISLARGHAGILPFVVFFLVMFLAAIGPGNIAMIAIIAPLGMAIAGEARIPALMMTIMVVNGANAGAFSPIAPTGIISTALCSRIGLGDVSMQMFFNTIIGNLVIALLAYFVLGGLKLWKKTDGTLQSGALSEQTATTATKNEPYNRHQIMSLAAIAILILGVILFKVDVGMFALALGVILILCKAADENSVIKAMPWHPLLMVSGVSLLMEFANKAGGLDIFTHLVAQISTPYTVTGVLGFLSGLISAYSSSSGVVMPAFLLLIPGLMDNLGGGNPLAMASAINVASHLVDASPLSTGGALCIAFAAAGVDRKKLFRNMMIWGLSMSVVGGIAVWIIFTVLAIGV